MSRLQASLKLAQDGHFYLHNLGRKGLQVSGKAVPAGSRCRLFDGCFLEVGGLSLVFLVNAHVAEIMRKVREAVTDIDQPPRPPTGTGRPSQGKVRKE